MNCKICSVYTNNAPTKSNNCIIDCLEKIKLHYLDMLKVIDDNKLAMQNLNETNLKLKESLKQYERPIKQEPIPFSQHCEPSQWGSNEAENEILNKTVDSLNVALNDEIDFDSSYVSDSPNRYKQKQKVLKREPMKTNTSANCSAGVIPKVQKKEEVPRIKLEASSLSKENKSALLNETSRKGEKTWLERPKLSLKTGLRQKRLQLGVKKKNSYIESFFGKKANQSSFCDSGSDLDKTDTTFCRQDDSLGSDHTFEFASPLRKSVIPKEEPILPENDSESSSVVILTPETQDIIFLDDSCNSNIESMDLLRDFVKPSDNRLSNLKLFESNRIKMLQKTASSKSMTPKTNNKPERDQEKDARNEITFDDLEETNLNESAFNEFNETNLEPPKEKTTATRDQRLLNLNCAECEKYIRYLGHRLSDEDIERHIRNCTKHKVNEEIRLTPEGFWDPMMKPLDKDDPRMKVLVDTRFSRKKDKPNS